MGSSRRLRNVPDQVPGDSLRTSDSLGARTANTEDDLAKRSFQARVLRHADDVVHPVVLTPSHYLLAGAGGLGPEQDLQPGPLRSEPGDDAVERFDRIGGRIGVAGPEQGEEREAPAGK